MRAPRWVDYTADRDDRRMWTDEQMAWLSGLSYEAGRAAERGRLADAQAELVACWRTAPRRTYAELIAERSAVMQACAAELAARLGRPVGWRYDGGPVDWDTGTPHRREAVA